MVSAHLLGARARHDARLHVRVRYAAAVQRVVVEGLGEGEVGERWTRWTRHGREVGERWTRGGREVGETWTRRGVVSGGRGCNGGTEHQEAGEKHCKNTEKKRGGWGQPRKSEASEEAPPGDVREALSGKLCWGKHCSSPVHRKVHLRPWTLGKLRCCWRLLLSPRALSGRSAAHAAECLCSGIFRPL